MNINKTSGEYHANTQLEFGALADMVGVELRNSQIAAEKSFARECGFKILPGHYTILQLLKNNPGQNQTTIANAVKLDRSTMVPIIDQFEKMGWVQRKPFAGDRRAYAIHLTKKGQQLVTRLEKYVEKMEQRITEGLGVKNRRIFIELLRKLQTII